MSDDITGSRTDRIAWRETGAADGVPIVLLHGFGGSGRSYRCVIAHLPPSRRVVTVDLPGHGGSAGYSGGSHPKAASAAILDALADAGFDAFHLCGFSLGGAVACLMTLAAPDRIRSLTLVAPGGFGPEIAGDALRAFAAALTETEIADALDRMIAPGSKAGQDAVGDLAAERADPALRKTLPAIAESISAGGRQGEIPRSLLATIECPVEIIWGTRDPVLPFAQSDDLPASFSLTRVEGAGHMLPDEAPGAVAAAIERALSAAERKS